MKTASTEQQIETCLRVLDDITEDRLFVLHPSHNNTPAWQKRNLVKLDQKFDEWHKRLVHLDQRRGTWKSN